MFIMILIIIYIDQNDSLSRFKRTNPYSILFIYLLFNLRNLYSDEKLARLISASKN